MRPEFDFKSGLVSVEGFVSTTRGSSFVRLSEINEFNIGVNRFVNVFIPGAQVSFLNTTTGNVVELIENEEAEIYMPPTDFVAMVGETWELEVVLSNGKVYRSLPETIIEPVAISDISATFNPELVYNLGWDDFVPGHSIQIDFEDPPGSENFYYWNYRSFERKDICAACYDAHIYRGGTCIPVDPYPLRPETIPIHTYYCESDCWRIRYNQNIFIFNDRFSDGLSIAKFPVGNVLLYTKKDILVEVQQFSLSASAYEYYETLKDIIDDNGGFNSPPSAALIGNMFSPGDPTEFVLGRFTAASSWVARTFLERSTIQLDPLENVVSVPEGTWSVPFPPEEYVFYAPCPGESRYNTSIRPEGWPTN
ncbi:hypothetical protein AAY42_09215 [Flagellimonas eckloniae]|uniref:DUF4249 domain-containing protein n=2 Tax=Flagellimonas eckloniae TaxID=346185 RepID=A0A0N8WFZ0_9FLAO|nr:hypothetical protein AAY42_09215 [Allomuricauda eckloniae]